MSSSASQSRVLPGGEGLDESILTLTYKDNETSAHLRESCTSTTSTMEDELWNLDLSDLLNNTDDNDGGSSRRSSLDHIMNNNSDGSHNNSPIRQQHRARSCSPTTSPSPSTSSRRARRFQNQLTCSDTSPNRGGPTRRNRIKRSVSFDKVKVRVFERVLAEHPPCATASSGSHGGAGGPSLGLGWNYQEKDDVDLEQFETKGSSSSSSSIPKMSLSKALSFRTKKISEDNKKKDSLLMSAQEREKLAKKFGFTTKEIQDNVKQVDKVIRQRNRTVKEVRRDEEHLEFQNSAIKMKQWFNKNAAATPAPTTPAPAPTSSSTTVDC